MRFEGKVVLITGATGGIGRETTRLFAKQGAKLVLVDLEQNKLEALALELEIEDYLLCVADVTNELQVKQFVQETKQKYGEIDVFFNNAGTIGKIEPITETTAEDLDHVLNVNVKGVFYGLKYVMAVMMEQNSGSIVNVASIAGLKGAASLAPYVASKHAVIGLTKSAALECAANGVRVNAICPGLVDTQMLSALQAGVMPNNPDSERERSLQNTPMKRFAQPNDIAELVLFLSSENASFITGGHYVIDGGLTVK